ncbi:MAG: hypothetical protein H6Q48_2502 [Deltaproteobacteria bacterium]|nr:hypothetical protein [Deltaproteobacteria bacterium]
MLWFSGWANKKPSKTSSRWVVRHCEPHPIFTNVWKGYLRISYPFILNHSSGGGHRGNRDDETRGTLPTPGRESTSTPPELSFSFVSPPFRFQHISVCCAGEETFRELFSLLPLYVNQTFGTGSLFKPLILFSFHRVGQGRQRGLGIVKRAGVPISWCRYSRIRHSCGNTGRS